MAQQTRVGGLPGFVVGAENLAIVLKELRALEPNLRKELVSEMKAGIRPIANDLSSRIPSDPPLSGFGPGLSPLTFGRSLGFLFSRLLLSGLRKAGTYPGCVDCSSMTVGLTQVCLFWSWRVRRTWGAVRVV
jgi:hypothetical protein